MSPDPSAPTPAPPAALLVDDEPLARARLKQLLHEAWPGLACIEAGDASKAADRLGTPGLAVVFLDIHLPGMDGMAWLAQLRGAAKGPGSPQIAVVLVSADPGQALQAYALDALDYLTKPVRRERLAQCLDKVRRAAAVSTPPVTEDAVGASGGADPAAAPAQPGPSNDAAALQVLLQDRQRLLRVPLAEVLYWRADHKLLELQTATACHVLDGSLQGWQDSLGGRVLRVHRNMLVPVQALRQLKASPRGWILQLQVAGAAPCWVPVSRRQLAAVKLALGAV